MLSLPSDLRNRTRKASEPVQLAPGRRLDFRDPAGYQPDEALVDAVKVALLLRKPLLVTGEPGTGKTDLGRYLAWKSGFLFFQFDAKSTSVARDLYYYYDALGRFQASQSGERTEAGNFLRLNGLGEAILQSLAPEAIPEPVRNVLPPDYRHEGPKQSVVVIDEIDKAPRDFPNDLLNELENSYFRIPELGIRPVRAGEGLEPVLVVTSNSEKNLPAPFLRRCVYYNIEFPSSADRLRDIVASRVTEFRSDHDSPMLADTLSVFQLLRQDASALTKVPATAELLDCIVAMLALGADPGLSLRQQSDVLRTTLPTMIKHASDRAAAETVVSGWLDSK